MRENNWRKSAFSCTVVIVHHGHGLSYPFPVSHLPPSARLSCYGYVLGVKWCAQIPMCALQMGCRLSAFLVLKLWLDQVYTAFAVKRFRSFLVSGLCTGTYSAIHHLPCSGMCLGASFKPHDEHGKLLMTLGEKKGTHRTMHAFCFCRQDCNERINCSLFAFHWAHSWHHAIALVWFCLSSVEKSASWSISLPSLLVCILLMQICSSGK